MRVLLVEDDGLVALTLQDMLEEIGCEVVFSGAAVGETLRWLADGGSADGAILDINLGGESALPVAAALAERGVPFAFSTGYGEAPDQRFAAAPLLAKPLRRAQLEAVLRGFGFRG